MKPTKTAAKPSAKTPAKTATDKTPAKTPAKTKAPVAIKKGKLYVSKTQNTPNGEKRRVKVTEVVNGSVHYAPVNYTRARPGKGRPVSEATFRRDYTLYVEA